MAFVLDASIAVSWAFLDEDHPAASNALDLLGAEPGIAPSLFWFEVRNILVAAERRGRLNPAQTMEFLGALSALPLTLDRLPDEGAVLQLARTHNLTVYDAAYLELARREGSMLATLDKALVRAAQAEGVTLIGS